MANPPKKKGTGYETEVVNAALEAGFEAERRPAGHPYDVLIHGDPDGASVWPRRVVEGLAMRPDRGGTLVSVRLEDFLFLLAQVGLPAHLECKRFARSAHHSIFAKKFGGTK